LSRTEACEFGEPPGAEIGQSGAALGDDEIVEAEIVEDSRREVETVEILYIE
jgi:hypothetical protein